MVHIYILLYSPYTLWRSPGIDTTGTEGNDRVVWGETPQSRSRQRRGETAKPAALTASCWTPGEKRDRGTERPRGPRDWETEGTEGTERPRDWETEGTEGPRDWGCSSAFRAARDLPTNHQIINYRFDWALPPSRTLGHSCLGLREQEKNNIWLFNDDFNRCELSKCSHMSTSASANMCNQSFLMGLNIPSQTY